MKVILIKMQSEPDLFLKSTDDNCRITALNFCRDLIKGLMK